MGQHGPPLYTGATHLLENEHVVALLDVRREHLLLLLELGLGLVEPLLGVFHFAHELVWRLPDALFELLDVGDESMRLLLDGEAVLFHAILLVRDALKLAQPLLLLLLEPMQRPLKLCIVLQHLFHLGFLLLSLRSEQSRQRDPATDRCSTHLILAISSSLTAISCFNCSRSSSRSSLLAVSSTYSCSRS